ncbi:DnaJ-domain-containing protein [Dissoconium aciculare CBS 342.82]|jgi:diphthamide biosynthesis protein 4|uniref:Diphthamide biosynthesis protein 4 n=1 Tax=Dissoconium aciculare CBS 342.82 TaxID=1314786 RepID=A0A6J3M852_9PEZI|nr:DnaJ-domain-containing protein [Dissoconium aciculare CBS 342.82]KAF1824170.1 DnaJ-domain-containing protein [Dissoconium aciculare CBS 342.82]
MSSFVDYYELLGLGDRRNGDDNVGTDELKRGYKRALLSHHPDKQSRSSSTSSITVDTITMAYQTLSDPQRRAEYDRQLQSRRAIEFDKSHGAETCTGLDVIDLGDLSCDEDSGNWTKDCRCGSQPAFVLTELELEANSHLGEVIVGCKGCSLWLKILYSVEE